MSRMPFTASVRAAVVVVLSTVPSAAQKKPAVESSSKSAPGADEELAPNEQTEKPAAVAEGNPGALEGIPLPTGGTSTAAPRRKTPEQKLWRDIVVAPHKQVIKARRFELAPYWGLNTNDPLVSHFALGIDGNYFLTDVLWVGLELTKYFSTRDDVDFQVRRTYRFVPRSNSLDYGAGLHFGYVPAHGKFTFVNQGLVHWEAFVTAGVGVVHSTIIPEELFDFQAQDASDNLIAEPTFSTLSIAPSMGVGGRIWVNQWFSLWFVFRDYVFNDHFEPRNREEIEDDYCESLDGGREENPACDIDAIGAVQDQAGTAIVNNLMFMMGASFFLPTEFRYTTFR